MGMDLHPDKRSSPSRAASTGNLYCCSISETCSREIALKSHVSPISHIHHSASSQGKSDGSESNYFRSAQWSPDGTSLLTTSADNTLRTFILPTDLLSPPSNNQPHTLHPYYTQSFPEPISTLNPHPSYLLSTPETCLLLASYRDHPITLHSALYPTLSHKSIASYPLINPTTEAYLTPSSLIFAHDGSKFLTGTDCLISLFDLSRNGEGAAMSMPTIPSKRHKLKGGGVGMRGIVSALALQGENSESGSQYGGSSASGILAAGTWSRWVGLYDSGGTGETIANFSVANQKPVGHDSGVQDASIPDVGGQGISQVLWSPCGRYLLVVERKSRGVLIYDIRVTGRLVGWLAGREADSNQRLGVDVCVGDGGGFEVWAGGVDGVVRVWEGVGLVDGRLDVSWEWKGSDDPITSTIIHPSRTVVATSSGHRKRSSDTDDDDNHFDVENSSEQILPALVDNTINIWSL